MNVDFSQFRNIDIMQLLSHAGKISSDLGLANIEPAAMLIAINQSHPEELAHYFSLCGVNTADFYPKLASILNQCQRNGAGEGVRISEPLMNALEISLQIERQMQIAASPHAPLATALLLAPGTLNDAAAQLGITTAKMQYALSCLAQHSPIAANAASVQPNPCAEGSASETVGLAEEIKKIDDYVEAALKLRRKDANVNLECDTIIVGATGTGKSFLSELFTCKLHQAGLIQREKPAIVDAVHWKLFEEKLGSNLEQLSDGVLIIDNAQKLVSENVSNNIGSLDNLFSAMRNMPKRPIVMLLGLPTGMNAFLEKNPEVRCMFEFIFPLQGYAADELAGICAAALKSKFNESLDQQCMTKLRNVLAHELRTQPEDWANGHSALKLADSIAMNLSLRGGHAIAPEDIPGTEEKPISLEDVIAEMDREFVGMQAVKDAIRMLGITMEANRLRVEHGIADPKKLGIHIMLTGNPGTGKTTVARTLGKALKAIHVLPTDKVIEADKSMLVGQYVGSTPIKVNEIVDRALGGILLVDEAYTLSQGTESGNGFGREAIDTLMKRMEDDRGRFVCILAGYRQLMDEFARVNPGINSRITTRIHIEDYTPNELVQIFNNMAAKEKMRLAPNAEKQVERAIDEMVAAKTKDFGNARAVRTLLDQTLSRQSMRIRQMGGSATVKDLATIIADDVPVAVHKTIDQRECLAHLDALVGLNAVKQEIRNIAQYLTLEKMRSEALGKKFAGMRDHYLFLGNPGTGKTTVARILADIFLSLGISKNTKFVEADRGALVAGYVGQTARLTNRVIDSALGGILFIDEAYSLNQGPHDNFGHEAIDTLLKRMEDDRGRFVCIAAGYSHEMRQFIASNSGLQSRFNKIIVFEDYSEDELVEIFKRKISQEGFVLHPDAEPAVRASVRVMLKRATPNFGNAREINNQFQIVKERQGNRIYALIGAGVQPSRSDILTLTRADFM